MPDAPGIAEGFDRYRSTLADLGAVDFDEQIYRAIEILAHRRRRPGGGPGPVPSPAGRRVPGPDPGPPAPDPAAGRPGLRLLRGGRRRPGHLRLLGGDARVPHRLPALLPRRRPPSARGQLPVPARRWWARPATSSPTTTGVSRRPSARPRAAATPSRRPRGPLAGAGPVAVRTARRRRAGRPGRRDHRRLAGRRASSPTTSPCWPGSTRRSCPSRWRAWRRACPAPRRSGSRRWAAPASAPPSPTCGSGPIPATSGGRTSGTPSAGRPGASPPWWWTC